MNAVDCKRQISTKTIINSFLLRTNVNNFENYPSTFNPITIFPYPFDHPSNFL